jgi:E3 ubiquitin-protein ligase RNF144
MCSRCSSLLSMASSSRYSLNTAGGGFVPCNASGSLPEQNVLCKLCLGEVPVSKTSEIVQCGCTFCKDVSKVLIMI